MKLFSFLFLLIFYAPLNAQWASFDLDGIESENFKKDVDPFIKSISLSMVNHFENPVNINNRLRLGFAYSHGINISGIDASSDKIRGYPNFGGNLLISENLVLKGNFSVFNSGDEIIQSIAYGLGLNLTNKEKNNWKLSLLFSQLKGPSDIRIKSMDSNIIYDFSLNNIPFFVGMGINSYKANILLDEEIIPNTIKGNANYLLFGLQYSWNRFTTTQIIKINSDMLVLSLELSGAVR